MVKSPAQNWTTIDYAVTETAAVVTLHRPEKLNAFTPRMADEIIAAIDRAALDDSVRALIITGAGRAFCAGADLQDADSSFVRSGEPVTEVTRDHAGRVTLALFGFPKPVIAAINGAAVGVGVTMTLAADLRIACRAARFGFVFSRRGIVPEGCSTWFLPRLVGIGQALQWCYSGAVIDAEEALTAGLIDAICEPEQLMARAMQEVQRLTGQSSAVSVALIRQMMWRMLGASHPMEAHRLESRALLETGAGVDAAEGVSAFLEKREPVFSARVSSDMPEIYPWWQEPPFHS